MMQYQIQETLDWLSGCRRKCDFFLSQNHLQNAQSFHEHLSKWHPFVERMRGLAKKFGASDEEKYLGDSVKDFIRQNGFNKEMHKHLLDHHKNRLERHIGDYRRKSIQSIEDPDEPHDFDKIIEGMHHHDYHQKANEFALKFGPNIDELDKMKKNNESIKNFIMNDY